MYLRENSVRNFLQWVYFLWWVQSRTFFNSLKHKYSITYVLILKNRKWKTRLCEFKNKTYNCCLHFKFICSISSRVKANNLSPINQLFVHLSKSSNGQINQSGSLLVLVKDSNRNKIQFKEYLRRDKYTSCSWIDTDNYGTWYIFYSVARGSIFVISVYCLYLT